MTNIPETANWRDSARSTRLWIFNSSTTFPIVLWIFHIKMWTFILALIVITFFLAIEYYGFKPFVFWRVIRSFMAGNRKFSRPWWLT